ncbi:MAG: Holliday junction resolvase RuvX [bacterium]|nr:Holliday junction resolvase RuvX [bacterium]
MYLAIDWGKKRIGLAVGTIFPKGAGVVDGEKSFEVIAGEIKKVIAEFGVEKIIIGLPVLNSGDEGNLAGEIRTFAGKISDETGLNVTFEPEQFTSTEAAEQFAALGKKVDRESGKLDELAAVLILEQFINRISNKSNKSNLKD